MRCCCVLAQPVALSSISSSEVQFDGKNKVEFVSRKSTRKSEDEVSRRIKDDASNFMKKLRLRSLDRTSERKNTTKDSENWRDRGRKDRYVRDDHEPFLKERYSKNKPVSEDECFSEDEDEDEEEEPLPIDRYLREEGDQEEPRGISRPKTQRGNDGYHRDEPFSNRKYTREDRLEDDGRDHHRRKGRWSRNADELKLQEAFFSTKSFSKLGASEEIIDALASLDVNRPSEIQGLSFGRVLSGNSCIIADQTGSGKTLAYLAPLVQRLRYDEENGNFSTSKNPRVLVLVPTSELAIQVMNVCRALSKKCPLKSMVATGGFKWKTQVENLERGPDIVVATPGRFLHLLEEDTIQLNKIQSVILDEVDILLEEEEFVQAMQKITQLVSPLTQYIHVTATLPTDVHDRILQKHPDSVPLLGPSLHLTAPGLNEVLVDCSGEGEKTPEAAFENKKNELLKLIQDQPVSKTIVFCNKIETCRKVENILKRYDRVGEKIAVLPYHAALTQEVRLKNMQEFLALKPELCTVLVCTDRASRGLDSIGVQHVVLFDFPRDPSEYIRRVGRTARAGGNGKVFVFVVGKQVSLARKIMTRNENRHPVHSVPRGY